MTRTRVVLYENKQKQKKGGEIRVQARRKNAGMKHSSHHIAFMFAHLAEALVVEPVNLGDLAGLVVAAQQAHPRREPHFEQHHQSCAFHLRYVKVRNMRTGAEQAYGQLRRRHITREGSAIIAFSQHPTPIG